MSNYTNFKRFSGLNQSAKSWLISKLSKNFCRILVVCKDKNSCSSLYGDLSFFLGDDRISRLPAWDILPFDNLSPQSDISAERIYALSQFQTSESFLTLTTASAVLQKVTPQDVLRELCLSLRLGQELQLGKLVDTLISFGFKRVGLVEQCGELALRGAVVDFFPAGHSTPVRIEFLGNSIDKIKAFDPETQRSSQHYPELKVLPVKEFIYPQTITANPQLVDESIERVKALGRKLETPPRELARVINSIKTQADLPGIENLQSLVFPELASVIDYLPADTLLLIDDEVELSEELDKFWKLIAEREERFHSEHRLAVPKESLFITPKDCLELIKQRSPTLLGGLNLHSETPTESTPSLNIASLNNEALSKQIKSGLHSKNALEPLKQAIETWRKSDFRIAFTVGSQNRAQRLHKLLLNHELFAKVLEQPGLSWSDASDTSPLVILEGHLSKGFQLPQEKLVFIAENEIFPERSYKKSKRSSQVSIKKYMSSLLQLKENDFIVHQDYGVGLYQGLKHIEIESVGHDFLQLEYEGGSKLYLPVENIGKIQKFISQEGRKPKLDRLGSNKWARTKAKVKAAVVTLAGDLIKLYATRNSVKGWRFEPYGAEDERFADEFPFDETPDQLAAINATLADMALDKPMDRLVCGDAGYGKTEVALRAAFKCIQHGRQVAILVPTTILVEQHKHTFQTRFESLGIKVGVLSRFYSSKQNSETISALAEGQIDIIIGTHKILQPAINFKDLGLLIIDEEHRFGVKHKETLKRMKKDVDVLTLTATPIPRTLHMALLGIRDISVISTPPHDRRAIRTYVATENETLIRDAMLRELQSGGQCFFMHNRVETIATVTTTLEKLVPEARFVFAHGQMKESQLEKVMADFIDRKFDILVSTTIIESGLDIPNCNTIIISRADKLGLAQLYQLRGRVGRGKRQAYAYLLIPEMHRLGSDARKRLKVLQALDDLGLGFNLATRDLEIRGAGNLLGKDQSGNVHRVGLELFNKILKEAVVNLRGEELSPEDSIDPELKLNINAYIPEPYIPDISERLILYQRMASMNINQDCEDLYLEIEDRFGQVPQEVLNLLELMRLRALLRTCAVTKCELSQNALALTFSPSAKVDLKKIEAMIKKDPESYSFSRGLTLKAKCNDQLQLKPQLIYDHTMNLLHKVLDPIANAT